MSSGCGDVLSLVDLQTAKKHQIFEAEVITGKSGGVAGGATIDYATNQVTGQTQKTLPAVLRDVGFSPAAFTFATGGTLGVNDANLSVLWPTPSGDGNFYAWHGALPKVIPASSSPASTGGVAPGAWQAVSEAALRSDLSSDLGATIVGTKLTGAAMAVSRTLAEVVSDSFNVKSFGAKGNWNVETQTGDDDTLAIQNCINFIGTLGNPRQAGRPRIHFPAGTYRCGNLTFPATLGFGLEITGDGWMSTAIRWDVADGGTAITSSIEFVRFSSISLIGMTTDEDRGVPANWKDVLYKAQLPDGRADIDVRYDNCALSQFKVFNRIYGRGCVYNNCALTFGGTATVVVADPSINLVGAEVKKGMRHYTFNSCRFDALSIALSVEGVAECKDYINDVMFTGCDLLGVDALLIFPDATLRRLVVSGCVGMNGFRAGVIRGKSIVGGSITACNFSANFDDSVNPDLAGDRVRSLILATGDLINVSATDIVVSNLAHNFIDCAGGSNITIENIRLPNAWYFPEQSNHYLFFATANISGLTIKNVKCTANAQSGTYHIYNDTVQNKFNIAMADIVAPWSWVQRQWSSYTPVLKAGASNAAGSVIPFGVYTTDDRYVYVETMFIITSATDTAGDVGITLPPIPAIAEFSTITGNYAGGGSVNNLVGFSFTGASVGGVVVNPSTQLAYITRNTNLVSTNLSMAQRSASIVTIFASFKYRYK